MPTTPARRMSKALKSELVPALNAAGFVGSFPRFRRHADVAVQFLSVQYDTAGTAFFLEFGSHPPGPKITSWGEVVPEEKLMLEHVPFDSRARLQVRSSSGSGVEDWFQFGHFGENPAPYTLLAASAAAMLAQAEDWLATQQVGPNVSPNAP